MKRLRIEISPTTQGHPTGVGYYTKQLSEAIIRQNRLEVHGCYFNFMGRQQTSTIEGYFKEEQMNFPQKIYAKLHSLSIALPFDIFLPKTDYMFFPNFAVWPSLRSGKKIVTIHDLAYLSYPETIEDKNLIHLRRVVPRAVKKSDLLVVSLETSKNELVKKFDIDPDKVHVLPIPPAEYFYIKSDRDVHETYSIKTKEYILFVSTIEPRKNIDTLLDAYEKLPSKIQDKYSLVIAGGYGWKTEKVHVKIDKLKAKGLNIVTTGYFAFEDSPALFQKATLLVMPSLYEGFGMTLLEAMAAHTATIASDIPVFREVCKDATVYFKTKDSDDLCKKVNNLLTDSVRRKNLEKKGQDILKRYNWDDVANKFIDRLEKL